jgi:tRNA pseudouridine55 synthase
MDGILLINKPKGLTSYDVVRHVKKMFKTKKVGHTGTLDPDATGLLIVAVNQGTKIIPYFNEDEKAYEATLCIGKSTDTLDASGQIIETKDVKKMDINFQAILDSFKGVSSQIPPMYSAIKVGGKKLYEYAREGIEIERKKRSITIYDIKETSPFYFKDSCGYASYYVHGSKGLYVRTLSFDIGRKLGYPAHNVSLQRTKAGRFLLSDAVPLEQLSVEHLIPIEDALPFETYKLNSDEYTLVKQGRDISCDFGVDMLSAIYQDKMVAILKKQNGFYHPIKVFQ